MPIPTLAEKLHWLKPAPATEFERETVKMVRPGEYEIGVQITNDILDEAMDLPPGRKYSRVGSFSRLFSGGV